jgi:epoxyqueuosine reductase
MTDLEQQQFKEELTAEAFRLGFCDIGFTTPDTIGEAGPRLRDFVDHGYHGEMDWMQTHIERRVSPRHLWAEAKSVVMLMMNYGPDEDPLLKNEQQQIGNISVYAQGHDYHDIVKKKLKTLARWLIDSAGGDVKVFVDTAPLMEKPLAQMAGLGWQGKHTNIVSRRHGSWTFLGSIFTTVELQHTEPETDHCGQCHACLDICPTQAFVAPYKMDARKCISYLTIEHKGAIPHVYREAIGNRIYGCDDCLAVCPWNKYAHQASELRLVGRAENKAPDLLTLVGLSDAAFRARFQASPIKRIGRARFTRNVLIAIGNMGTAADERYLLAVEALLNDEAPIIRGAAIWALKRLDLDRALALLPALKSKEPDTEVLIEWEMA